MDDRDEDVVVIYSSHTATEAYPGGGDILGASEPAVHYALVSTRHLPEVEFRSFHIENGQVTEEYVEIVDRYTI